MTAKPFQVHHGLRAGSTLCIDSNGNWVGNNIPASRIVGSPLASGIADGTTTGEILYWTGSQWQGSDTGTTAELQWRPGSSQLHIGDGTTGQFDISVSGNIGTIDASSLGQVSVAVGKFRLGTSNVKFELREHTGGVAAPNANSGYMIADALTWSDIVPSWVDENTNIYPMINADGHWFQFSTATAAADPTAGYIRFNSATPASVTNLYIDDLNHHGNDEDSMLSNLADGDLIRIRSSNAPDTVYWMGTVNGTPTDNTGWWTVPVTHIASGTLPSSNTALQLEVQWLSQAAGGGGSPVTTKLQDLADVSVGSPQTTGNMFYNDGTNWVSTSNMSWDETNRELVLTASTGAVGFRVAATGTDDWSIENAAGNPIFSYTDASGGVLLVDAAADLRVDGGVFRIYDSGATTQASFTASSGSLILSGTNYFQSNVPITMLGLALGSQPASVIGSTVMWSMSEISSYAPFVTSGHGFTYPLVDYGMYQWRFNTPTANADPGAGFYRLNNTSYATATEIYVDDLDIGGDDAQAFFDLLQEGDLLTIRQGLSRTSYWALYRISGAVTDNTGWWTIPVELIDNGANFFSNADIAQFYLEKHSRAQLKNLADVDTGSPNTPATGDTLYYNGTSWVNLPQGTNGQVLTVGSPGPIVWATAASGGGSPQVATLQQVTDKGNTTTNNISGTTYTTAAALGDKISLYDDRLGLTTGYNIGVEGNAIYYKTGGTVHRWYIGVNADGGTSDTMELSAGTLTLNAGITVNGAATFSDGSFGATEVIRESGTGASAIQYSNTDGTKGYAGFDDNGDFTVYDAALGTMAQISAAGSLYLDESSAADADIAGYGQIWVRDTAPNSLWFRDDTGVDYKISGGSPTNVTIDGTQVIVGAKTFTTNTRIADSGNTDYAEFSHDGTNFLTNFTNTAEWRLRAPGGSGAGTVWISHNYGSPGFNDIHTSSTTPTLRVGVGSPTSTVNEATIAAVDAFGGAIVARNTAQNSEIALNTNGTARAEINVRANSEFFDINYYDEFDDISYTIWSVLPPQGSATDGDIDWVSFPHSRFRWFVRRDVFASTENNLNVSTTMVTLASVPAGGTTLTGISGNNNDGLMHTVTNVAGTGSPNASGTITCVHESASSGAANRFLLPGSPQTLTIAPNQSATFIYDSEVSRWIPYSTSASGGGGAAPGGGLTGTVANDQLVVGTGTSTVDSSAALTFDGTTLLVDTDGAGPMVTIGDGAGADGDTLLRLNIDRAWRFKQRNTGAGTELDLQSEVDNKVFNLTDINDAVNFRFGVGTSSVSFRTYSPGAGSPSEYLQLEFTGNDGKISTGTGNIWLQPGAGAQTYVYRSGEAVTFRVYDGTGSDYISLSHDGTDANITTANTSNLNVTGVDRIFAQTTGARFQSGPDGGGTSATFGSTQNTDGGSLNYRSYLGYDMYWDDTNDTWVGNRTSLGRKMVITQSYHDGGVRFKYYNGSPQAAFGDSNMTTGMEIDHTTPEINLNYTTNVTGSNTFNVEGASGSTYFRIDRTATETNFTSASASDTLSIKGGQFLQIYDSGNTDYMRFRHNGTDAYTEYTNTTWHRFDGIGSGWLFLDGGDLRVYRTDNTEYVTIRHDGTNGYIGTGPGDGPMIIENEGTDSIRTQTHTTAGNTTGADIIKHDGIYYDIGINTMPVETEDVSDTLEATHCGGVYFKDGTGAITLTLEASGTTDFPIGGVVTVINANTTGNISVNEGSGTTLYYLDGSTRTDTAGGATVGPGGVATVWREATTIYYIWGSGITP